VAIFNSRPEFIGALRVALEADGFTTSSAHLADIQDGTLDLLAFVHLHRPELIVYDLPRPYESHWNFLRLLKETNSLKAATWVLATTDKRALEAAVGASGVVEIIFGEPYGVDDVVAAVSKRFPEIQQEDQGMMDQQLPLVHVLVVDDSPDIRGVLIRILEAEGATVTAVGTAEQALDLLEQLRPDVLLSDLEMPEKDGYWLIRRVRALAPNRGGLTPAACLTGSTDPEARARILRAGFQYHIAKPVDMLRLLGVVGILALSPKLSTAGRRRRAV
jgi:CheY-like chemotaxis protein